MVRRMARKRRWHGRAVGVLAAAAVASLTAATASAVTFGADLSREPDVAFDCTLLPVDLGSGINRPSGAQTCTYSASPESPDAALGPSGSADISAGPFAVPAGFGKITAFRVRAGAMTGPMRFTVLRTATIQGHRICCEVTAVTPPFTPTPNQVTTVPASIPVRHDTAASPGRDPLIDTIALSILAPGVPIPAHDTIQLNTESGPPIAIFPALTTVAPLGNPSTSLVVGLDRFQVLISADWVAAPNPAVTTPRLTVGTAARLVGTTALVALRCRASVRCSGVARLQSRTRAGASTPLAITYATARFNLRAGASATVRMALNAAGRRAAAKSGARAWVNVTVGTRRGPSTRVTLRRR